MRFVFAAMLAILLFSSCKKNSSSIVSLTNGWANNSVNTTIFRKNSLVTHNGIQYISYYDKDMFVVLGKRIAGSSEWQLERTQYKGNAADAHNAISIMADRDGYLHMAWNNHNNALHYCRSISPGSLELTDEMPMTGKYEQKVTYPEFHKMPDGNLLFFYRNGESGKGNMVINHYDAGNKEWIQVQSNLISGEGLRSAYWQAFVDQHSLIHVSWVWRENGDVSSNHDMCYAVSKDGGNTWEKSTGEKYALPVKQSTAEYVAHIPQHSELINQTSMCTDEQGNPYIATYWKDANDAVPQYHILYLQNEKWMVRDLAFRTTGFGLSGTGTKAVPISRPQIITWQQNDKAFTGLIFRDEERVNKVSLAILDDVDKGECIITDLQTGDMGAWEPTYDTELWKEKKQLQLFLQRVVQVDAEGKANVGPEPVSVLEWRP
ncbi:BNR repeat-containing protein [soil metagenome]